ncbi:MAG: division/cell wall cluster transcriptional repressor MraZ [Ignavibacteria bacterium]|jgi:MraZ protein|nr:division/cell wall cluster transcriptional repressor MraZ [Ignavibacteria bacterium]
MVSFKGSETFTLDQKGRVKFPAKMLKSVPTEANDTFVVTRGLDKCVFAYPMNVWDDKYTTMFEALNQFDSNHRKFLRWMLEWSEEMILDTQQRISIPKELLEYAGIVGKVRVIGMMDHIEFWSPEQYEQYRSASTETYEEIVEKVMTTPTN